MALLFSIWLKFFFLFAPFFVISMFLSLTREESKASKRSILNRAAIAATIACLLIFFFGTPLFQILGITLDSFRVGSGILLFLSAISLVREGIKHHPIVSHEDRDDVAVVPLAIPTIVGPATTGTVMVYGAELKGIEIVYGVIGLLLALTCLFGLLHLSATIERFLGKSVINILSKVTGLVLSAMAAQIIFTGAANMLHASAGS